MIVELLIAAIHALPELMRTINPEAKRPEGAFPAVSESQEAFSPFDARQRVIKPRAFLESPKVSTAPEIETAGRFMLACLLRAAGDETPGGAIYVSSGARLRS